MAESLEEKRQYAAVTVMMQNLHKYYISCNKELMKEYVEHFNEVLKFIIKLMQETSSLFSAIFQCDYGIGSYYDDLKVGQPEEFDVNMIVKLPIDYNEIIIENHRIPPGFIKVNVQDAMRNLHKHPDWNDIYRGMEKWVNEDGFLLQTEFRYWFEGVVNRAVRALAKYPHYASYKVLVKKSGPAMTLSMTVPVSKHDARVSVDLVPVIQFSHQHWPPNVRLPPISLETVEKKTWFIVPKLRMTKQKKIEKQNANSQHYPVAVETNNACYTFPVTTNIPESPAFMMTNILYDPEVLSIPYYPQPTNSENPQDHRIRNRRNDIWWRISFPIQEREMIKDKGHLKPVCRIMKRYRDIAGLNIVSYSIKTLFLLELERNSDDGFWKQREIHLFLHMMCRLKEYLENGRIPFYWDDRCNLIERHEVTNTNDVNRLKRAINDIRAKIPQEPFVIMKYMVSREEYELLKKTNFPY